MYTLCCHVLHYTILTVTVGVEAGVYGVYVVHIEC